MVVSRNQLFLLVLKLNFKVMNKHTYLLLFSFLLLSGCEKFLDVKSDARLVVPHSLEDAQSLLDNVLRMNEQTVPARGEDAADDYYVIESVYNGLSETIRKFYVWEYQEYRGNSNDWGAAYAPVFNANLALDVLENTKRTDQNMDNWDNIKGSALFYRAFYFFKLLVVFSPAYDAATADLDHGIALRLDSDFNRLSVRASVSDCFKQIFEDLNTALELLPDYPRHSTRPSKGAVYALFSNIHHYMRNYDESLRYANLALTLNKNLIDFNGDSDLLPFNSTNTAPHVIKFNKETIFYAEMYNALITHVPNRFGVDTTLVDSYQNVDLRRLAFFQEVGDLLVFKGNLTGSYARKFGGLSTSEVFLNKAESLAILNKPQEAIETLNLLLEKRLVEGAELLDPANFDQVSAIITVRDERRKELLFRGIRFADIKRYNKESPNIQLKRHIGGKDYVLEPNSSRYALPIPEDIIEITGIPQN